MLDIRPDDFLDQDKVYIERKSVIDSLYNSLKPVTAYSGHTVVGENKYIKLAEQCGYVNYRIGTISDLMRLKLVDSFSAYNRQFFKEVGIFLAIFNTYSGKPVGIVFRDLSKKEFIDFSIATNIYGLDFFSEDFKYGDPIVVTEGIYDADVFRQINRNTVAVYTSSVSVMQAEILHTITDKFVMALDADDAGERGFNTSVKNLKRVSHSCIVNKLPIYRGDKDLGDIENGYEKNIKLDYYRMSLKVSI